jgi:hypothetical protein
MDRPTLTSLRVPYRGAPCSEQVNLYRNQFHFNLKQLFKIYNEQAKAVDEDMAKNLDHTKSYTGNAYHPFPAGLETGYPIAVKLNSETVAMTFEKPHLISIGYKNLKEQINLSMKGL